MPDLGSRRVSGMARGIEEPARLRGLHVHPSEPGTLLHERGILRETGQVHVRGARPGQPELHPRVGSVQPKFRRHERRVPIRIVDGKREDRVHDRS